MRRSPLRLHLFALVVLASGCTLVRRDDELPTADDRTPPPHDELATNIDADVDDALGAWPSGGFDGPAGSGSTPTVTTFMALHAPGPLAADADAVYVIDDPDGAGTILRAALDGGPPSVVAVGQTHATALALDATRVYWTLASGVIASAPKTGGPRTVVTSLASSPTALVVDETNAWFSTSRGAVLGAPLGGDGSLGLVIASTAATAVVVDDARVYWSTATSLLARTKTGTTVPHVLATGLAAPSAIAIDAADLWIATRGASSGDGAIVAVSKAGGARVLAANQPAPVAIARGDDFVAWACAGDGSIRAAKVDGPSPSGVLAGSLGSVASLAIAGRAIYVAAGDATHAARVVRIAR